MDELSVVLEARKILGKVKPTSLPVPLAEYAAAVGATIRIRTDLESGQSGMSFSTGSKWVICVNGYDSPGRQKFTVCHEIAHIALSLPSDHGSAVDGWTFGKRPRNEILCDRFAAELLIPHSLFKPLVERVTIGIAALKELADSFDASLTATGIRFVTVASAPCAFVVSEAGRVRYAQCSTSLRSASAWIPAGSRLPEDSVSAHVRMGLQSEGPETTVPEKWFREWNRQSDLLEDAIHLKQWDQTLTLLWFEDEELPVARRSAESSGRDDEEPALKELDGVLPWPSKRRRR